MPIEVSSDSVVTVVLANGKRLVLPEIVTGLKLDAQDETTFHQYDSDSIVGFRSHEDWNKTYGEEVGRPFNMGPTTYENVYKALRHVPAPENLVSATHIEGKAVNTGDVTNVAVLGEVTHLLFPEYGVLVNVTLPSHKLHPGIVVRQVVEKEGVFSIFTEGVGNGANKTQNEWLADWIWSSDDVQFSATGGVDTRLMLVLKAFDGRNVPEVIERDPNTGAYRGSSSERSQTGRTDKAAEQNAEFFAPSKESEVLQEADIAEFNDLGSDATGHSNIPEKDGALAPLDGRENGGALDRSTDPASSLAGPTHIFEPRVSSFDKYRQLGRTPEEEAQALVDYEALFRDSFIDMNGDKEAAGLLASERFGREWGLSDYAFDAIGIVLKHPLEKAYPALRDAGHNYVRADVEAQLEELGVKAARWYLSPNDKTGADKRRGGIDDQGFGPRMTLSYENDIGEHHVVSDSYQVDIMSAASQQMRV